MSLRRSPEQSTPRMAPSSGSTCGRSPTCMSMGSPSVPGLPTRLVNMRSLERSRVTSSKLMYVTITNEEKEVEVKELKTLSEAMEAAKADFPGLVHWRVPVCNSASPLETDFDIICNTLVGTSINTPVIVTDQVGLSRATTGS